MPIISRRKDESIVIGDTTFVTVIGFHRGQARLLIDLPDDVEVWRIEEYDRYAKQVRDGSILQMPKRTRPDAKRELIEAAKQAAQFMIEYGFDQGETFRRLTKAILEVSEDRRIG